MNLRSKFSLGRDVVAAIPQAKQGFYNQTLRPHDGSELSITLYGKRGAYLLEYPVGVAHEGDPRPAGKRRLVLQIDSNQIKRIYFSDDHYRPGSWCEISDW